MKVQYIYSKVKETNKMRKMFYYSVNFVTDQTICFALACTSIIFKLSSLTAKVTRSRYLIHRPF